MAYRLIKKLIPLKLKTFLKKKRKFNSINSLDKKLLKYVNFRNGYYIECGANDGVNQSNTWHYEKFLNWEGILIEPNKEKYNQLKKNRNKNNIFINKALVSKFYQNKYIYISNENLESKVAYNFNSTNIKCKATTLEDILIKKNIKKKIDLFSLDVEGYEMEVLKGVDFNKFMIEYILIETYNLELVSRYLSNYNYSFIEKLSKLDYLFVKTK